MSICTCTCAYASTRRVFVHYQPQFYRFHVHFTRLHNDLGCQVHTYTCACAYPYAYTCTCAFTRLHDDLGCQIIDTHMHMRDMRACMCTCIWQVERAHLLHEIIDTLEDRSDAYQHRTLYYQLKANDKLLAKINLAGGDQGKGQLTKLTKP